MTHRFFLCGQSSKHFAAHRKQKYLQWRVPFSRWSYAMKKHEMNSSHPLQDQPGVHTSAKPAISRSSFFVMPTSTPALSFSITLSTTSSKALARATIGGTTVSAASKVERNDLGTIFFLLRPRVVFFCTDLVPRHSLYAMAWAARRLHNRLQQKLKAGVSKNTSIIECTFARQKGDVCLLSNDTNE